MEKKELTLREKVEAILNDESLTSYRIAKELNVYVNSVDQLRSGKGQIGNIRLEFAEKYAELYDRLQQEKETENDN